MRNFVALAMVRKLIGVIAAMLALMGVGMLVLVSDPPQAAWGMVLVVGAEILVVATYVVLAVHRAPFSLWRTNFPSYHDAARVAKDAGWGLLSFALEDFIFLFFLAAAASLGGGLFLSRIGEESSPLFAVGVAFVSFHMFMALVLGFAVGAAPYVKWFAPTPEKRAQAEALLRATPRPLQWVASGAAILFFIIVLGVFSWGTPLAAHLYFHPDPIAASQWQTQELYRTKKGCFVVVPDNALEASSNALGKLMEAGGKAIGGRRYYPPGSTLWCVNTPANGLILMLLSNDQSLERLKHRTYP